MSYIDPDTGYRYVWKPNHPNAKDNGYASEHRVVMSKKLGRPLTSSEHVHHKDENKLNNNPKNLEVLGPAEHVYKHNPDGESTKKCEYCGDKFHVKPSTYERRSHCSKECRNKAKRKVKWPSRQRLEKLIDEKPFTELGEIFGVSDNAVRNWADKYGIDY